MRKILGLAFLGLSIFSFTVFAQEESAAGTPEKKAQKVTGEKFDIFTEKNAPGNHFIPSGWMGDVNDMQFSDQSTDNPASGATCIKIVYTAKKSAGQGWAGIYWQSSQNNWGTKNTGYDLSGFNKLTFKARGKNGGEIITIAKIGGITKNQSTNEMLPFADSLTVENGPYKLTKEWQEFSLNLVEEDLSYVNGGLCIVFNADQAGGEQTVYLDDVSYIFVKDLKKETKKTNFPFYVYSDAGSLDNHFIPSGWMPATAARDLKFDPKWKNTPFSGTTCIRVEYKDLSGTRWAGIFWQQPANNWGTVPKAGFDLTGAKRLTFWVRGDKGGEVINEFKVGGISSGDYIDSDSSSIGPITLTTDWKQYDIDLDGRDLSYVIGGFCWATNIDVNSPEGIVFYLDEIKYEDQ